MKTYVIDVRYYIPADDINDFHTILDRMEIKDSEYYGGCEIVGIEEEEKEEGFLEDLLMEQQEQM